MCTGRFFTHKRDEVVIVAAGETPGLWIPYPRPQMSMSFCDIKIVRGERGKGGKMCKGGGRREKRQRNQERQQRQDSEVKSGAHVGPREEARAEVRAEATK
jgi:hypothetical protein